MFDWATVDGEMHRFLLGTLFTIGGITSKKCCHEMKPFWADKIIDIVVCRIENKPESSEILDYFCFGLNIKEISFTLYIGVTLCTKNGVFFQCFLFLAMREKQKNRKKPVFSTNETENEPTLSPYPFSPSSPIRFLLKPRRKGEVTCLKHHKQNIKELAGWLRRPP